MTNLYKLIEGNDIPVEWDDCSRVDEDFRRACFKLGNGIM